MPRAICLWLVARSARRPRLTLLLTLAVIGASIAGLSRLHVDSTLSGMLGGGHSSAEALARIADDFHASEDLLVVAVAGSSWPDTDAERQLLAFADRLSLAAAEPSAVALGITGVRYRPDSSIESYYREVVLPAAALWLDDDSFTALMARLSPEGVREQLAQSAAMLAAPGPGVSILAKQLMKDPLRLHELFLADLGIEQLEVPGATFSDDGRALLIRVSGARPVNDIEFAKRFTAGVRDLAGRTNTAGLEIRIGGGYAVAATTATAIRADAISSTITSAVLISLFLVFAYRGLIAPLAIVFSAGTGVVAAFGLYSALAASITPLTAVLAAMLAGLGVDYAIHFRSLYDTGRASGLAPASACAVTARELAGPLVAACLTSVFGFGAVALSELRMLKAFAILGCTGLVGAMIAVWVVLPAILSIAPRGGGALRLGAPRTSRVGRGLLAAAARRPARLLGAGAMVGGASLIVIATTSGFAPSFDSDPSVLHPQPNAALETGQFVRDRFRNLGENLLVHVAADSPHDLVARAHDVARRLATPEARAAGVRATVGMATLAPDPSRARRRLDVLKTLDAGTIVAGVESEFERSEFDAGAFAEYIRFVRRLLSNPQSPTVEDVLRHPELAREVLPAASIDTPGVSPRQTVVVVTVTRDAAERPARGRVIDRVRSLIAEVPGATLTGLPVVSRDLEVAAKRDLGPLGIVSITLVISWLSLLLRRPADVALAFVPVLFTLICVLGFMSARGDRPNIVSIVALPLLAGIAVDSGIFLVATARRSAPGRTGLLASLRPTVHAITCTTVTTLLGFGSLAWTHTPAVRSLGYAMLVGMTSSLAACFLIVIPLLMTRARHTPRRPR